MSIFIDWTPRNTIRRTDDEEEAGVEEGANDKTLRTVVLPRLIRVLAPFAEARAAVAAMFNDLARMSSRVPEWTG